MYRRELKRHRLTFNYFEYLGMFHFKVFLQGGGISPHKCLLTDLTPAPSDLLVQLWVEDLYLFKLLMNNGEIDLRFFLWRRTGG